MIHFISGKPGGGKTMYAVQLILKELLQGNRLVVTNVPLNLENLSVYLQRTAPDTLIPLVGPEKRVHLLDASTEARDLYEVYSKKYYSAGSHEQKEEIYREYETRIKELKLPEEARTFWRFRNITERRFDADCGTLFVLDEIHIHFNARKWQQTGEECLHYLSQHRKFGDTVICITQALSNVDKQFISVAEDFSVIRNEYTMKYGVFRGRGRFLCRSYYAMPTGSRHQQPFEEAGFKLDVKGVASCYDTAAGVGVHGNKADVGKRAKGIPILLVVPGFLLLASLCYFIPAALGSYTQNKLSGGKKPAKEAPKEAGAVPDSDKAPAAPKTKREQLQEEYKKAQDEYFELMKFEPLSVVSYSIIEDGQRTRVRVELSDGSVFTERDKIERIEDDVVTIAGRRFRWKAKGSRGEAVSGGAVDYGKMQPGQPVSTPSMPFVDKMPGVSG